jgi:hypothetical protein
MLTAADAVLVVLLLVLLLWFACAATPVPLLLLLPLLDFRRVRCLAAGAALLLLLLMICDAIQPSRPSVDASAASAGDTVAAAAAAATAEQANSIAARCLAGDIRFARVLLRPAWLTMCPTLSWVLRVTAVVQRARVRLLVVLAGRSAARCIITCRLSCMCLLTVLLLPPHTRAGSSGILSGLVAMNGPHVFT